jgi:hypothetical protein
MSKLLIYIIRDDTNWLKGLEYFVVELQLDYSIVQYKSVEKVLKLESSDIGSVYAIILDWELSSDGLNKENAIAELEGSFPFIPVIAISAYEFMNYHSLSNHINKKTTDPEELFNTVAIFTKFYRNNWINECINRITYVIESFDSSTSTWHIEQSFYNINPLIARTKIILKQRQGLSKLLYTLFQPNRH